MKQTEREKRFLSAGLILALSLSSFTTPSTQAAAKKIRLSKSTLSLKTGKSAKLQLKNVSEKKRVKIKWTTSNKKVVSIVVNKKNKSIVTLKAKKKGKATITAKLSGKKYKCKVTVKNSGNATKTTATPTAAQTEKPTAAPSEKPTPTPQIIYVEVTPEPTETPSVSPAATVPTGNLTYQSDVTAEMTKASYWAELCDEPDKVLIDAEGIEKANQRIVKTPETYMCDLLNQEETYNATTRKQNLAKAIDDDIKNSRLKAANGNYKEVFLDGEKLNDNDIEAFCEELKANILAANTEEEATVKYGLCTKASELKMAPVSGFVGFSATDTDEEFTDSRLNVNEPVIIEAVTGDGKFYWGKTTNCSGWIRSDCVAICDSKEEWKDMWTKTGEDILVVTSDSITLAPSVYDETVSKIELSFATVLPLVPEDEMPGTVDDRGTWYNYVVYIPTRDENGKFVRKMALISMNNKVSIGYLPFTKRNVLEVAFSCLGNRYGWGGMYGLMDCSLYTRDIYKCFGFELARNTSWQRAMPVGNIDLEGMDDKEKREAIDSCEPGTLLMFKGHITMYIGSVNGKQYVISDTGSMAETEEAEPELDVQKKFSVCINTLDVRRGNGTTWLSNLLWAGCPWMEE